MGSKLVELMEDEGSEHSTCTLVHPGYQTTMAPSLRKSVSFEVLPVDYIRLKSKLDCSELNQRAAELGTQIEETKRQAAAANSRYRQSAEQLKRLKVRCIGKPCPMIYLSSELCSMRPDQVN
jgi:hypothetical protein